MLTEDVVALRTQPPAAVSAMDGYAVRASDVAQAPVTLKVIGEVAAGHPFDGKVGPGEAARIFTGGVMPAGSDTVVIQELTTRESDHVTIQKATAKGRNVRAQGIDFARDQNLLRKGRRLTDRDLMLAAAMNHPRLSVHRRPKVAVLGTGDELVPPGSTPRPGEIVLFQRLCACSAWHASEGAEVHDLGIARDRVEDITAAVRRAREWNADILVTSGGASVGEHDLVQQALAERGSRFVVLAGGAAPRPPDDAWPPGRHAGSGRAGQPGIVLCVRLSVPGPADRTLAGRRTSSTYPSPRVLARSAGE